MLRAGFLFNHYLSYQVLHGAPFAFELSRLAPDIHVELLFSSIDSLKEAKRIAKAYPEQRCHFTMLENTWPLTDSFPALHRPSVLLSNRRLLAGFDALIAPEKNYINLKVLPAFRKIRFIGLRHGAGDRPVSFNKGFLKFDYLLVPGQSYLERFRHELREGCCRIAGYPKFEVLEKLQPQLPKFFDNDKPVVLYTPHFHRQQSSWLKMGEQVLNYFANSGDYNLIFAPHARLFRHRSYHGDISIDKFRNLKNIYIDTGSDRSYDMTYTRSADIYLGDVSSQVYEFLYHKLRPCIFLNANGLDPATMNFWQCGPVLDRIERLQTVLQDPHSRAYSEIQNRLLDLAFYRDDIPASQRGAAIIESFLKEPV